MLLIEGVLLTSCEPVLIEQSLTEKELNQDNVKYLKILIDQEGIYELSSSELANVGMAILDPSEFHLYIEGVELPYWLEHQSDGFSIRFYGQESRSLFTNDSVYWLINGENCSIAFKPRRVLC